MIRKIKHALKRLSAEEKVIGLGGLLVFFGAFMPWYSVTSNFDQSTKIESGLSGDLGVMGFVVVLATCLSLLHLVSDNLHIKLPTFGYKKEQILLFLMGETAFLVLLGVAVYTTRSLDFTSAELRFGIYMSLIGAILGTFATFAQIQKIQKKETQAFFDHPEDSEMKPEEALSMDQAGETLPAEESFREKFEKESKKTEKIEAEPADQIEINLEEEMQISDEPKLNMSQGANLIRDAKMFSSPKVTLHEEPSEEMPKKTSGKKSSFYED